MPAHVEDREKYCQQVLDRIKKRTTYDGECWRYDGVNEDGYGRIYYRNKMVYLNQFIAFLYLGYPDPEFARLVTYDIVCHKPMCKFKDCWNPEHLYVGTKKTNAQDMIDAGTFVYGFENKKKVTDGK